MPDPTGTAPTNDAVTNNAATSNAVDVLLAKQAIRELVYQIARGVDRADPAQIVAAFHEDGTDDHGSYQGPAAGFAEWATSFPMVRSQHAIANVLSEVDGDVARAESYFTAQHNWVIDGEMTQVMAGGRYLDSFERRAGVWKLTHRHAIYDWEHLAPLREGVGNRTDGTRDWGERGTTDVSYDFFAGGPSSASGS